MLWQRRRRPHRTLIINLQWRRVKHNIFLYVIMIIKLFSFGPIKSLIHRCQFLPMFSFRLHYLFDPKVNSFQLRDFRVQQRLHVTRIYDKVLAIAFVAVVLTVDGLSCHGLGYLDRLRENRCLVFCCLKLLPFPFQFTFQDVCG